MYFSNLYTDYKIASIDSSDNYEYHTDGYVDTSDCLVQEYTHQPGIVQINKNIVKVCTYYFMMAYLLGNKKL